MKSSVKITLWIIFIKIFFNNEIILPEPDNLPPLKVISYTVFFYFKAIVFANFYAEALKVLSIVLRYLNQ